MKKILIVIFLFLIFIPPFGFIPTNDASEINQFSFRFAVISDTHIDKEAKDKPDSFKLLNQSADLLRIAIDEINAFNSDTDISNDIDFVLFCGDNINSNAKDDYNFLFEILNDLETPFFMIPGDWDFKVDYSPPTINKSFPTVFENLSKENLNKENLSENILFDNSAYPGVRKYDFSLDFKNSDLDIIHIIGMDNVLHFNSKRGSYEPEQLDWLETDLIKNSNKPVIIIQHCPVIAPVFADENTSLEKVDWIPRTNKSDRETPNLNIVMHNPWWVNKAADKSEEFLALMEQYQVPLILMGDYHLNKKALYPNENPQSLLTINPALVSYPCAYTIYTYDESAISWEVCQIEKYADKCEEYNRRSILHYNDVFSRYGVGGMRWDIEITMGLSWGIDDGDINDWRGHWEYGE